MKRLILQNPMFRSRQSGLGNIHLRQVLFEPLYVVAACLAWLAILPITGVFCAGVDVYDKVKSPHWT